MIPFNKPFLTGQELIHIEQAIKCRSLSGDGEYTKKCSSWLQKNLNVNNALITHSATAALEMAALLADLKPGDEVIMPSFTFVSTANSVVLRGATPVFIDIKADTLNLDENLISDAITDRTRAILPVHYAGVACEMDEIISIARKNQLLVIEDSAQAIMSSYKGKQLGTIGDMGALSFHSTKNISCGEGGAFLTNNSILAEKAEIVREKGTNRSKFFRGLVDKYNWIDVGSSYLPSELNAAFLYAQLESAKTITKKRIQIWDRYHSAFEEFERIGIIIRPKIPLESEHNGHIYWFILPNLEQRSSFIENMNSNGISCTFHYVPLHSSPKGRDMSRVGSDMKNTNLLSDRLIRMPIYPDIENELDKVIEVAKKCIHDLNK